FAEKLAADIEEQGTESAEQETASEDASFDVTDFEAAPVVDDAAETSFDTSFNFGFDFGPSEEISTIAAENATDSDASHEIDSASFNPFAPVVLKKSAVTSRSRATSSAKSEETAMDAAQEKPAFRKPGDVATLPELIKFLNNRSGYIRVLEEEATPESFSRIENLKELANAAQ